MVDWCKKHRKPTEEAKSKCSEQCSNRCRFFGFLSESDYRKWLRNKFPSQTSPTTQTTTSKHGTSQTRQAKELTPLPKKSWILIDANILIYSRGKGEKADICQRILCEEGLATTYLVKKEAGDVSGLKIFMITKISKELNETKSPGLKQASIADKSLIQAAVNYHTIIGIITYDKDFFNLAAKGYVERKSHYKRYFWVINAEEYLIKIGQYRRKY